MLFLQKSRHINNYKILSSSFSFCFLKLSKFVLVKIWLTCWYSNFIGFVESWTNSVIIPATTNVGGLNSLRTITTLSKPNYFVPHSANIHLTNLRNVITTMEATGGNAIFNKMFEMFKLDQFNGSNVTHWNAKLMFFQMELGIAYLLSSDLLAIPESTIQDSDKIKVARKKIWRWWGAL